MGYTYYVRQSKPASNEKWTAVCNDFKKFRAAALLLGKPFPIQREEDDSSDVLIDDECIIFNGIGEDAHETFMLEKAGDSFSFCKTNRKPYDTAVVTVLILANHHAPDVWGVSSDGVIQEWQPVLDWMNSTGIGTFTLPESI